MPQLLQFEYESWYCFKKPTASLFKFRGHEFRWISGEPNHRECLFTVMGDPKDAIFKAQRDCMLFLACLAWEYPGPYIPRFGGGPGVPYGTQLQDIDWDWRKSVGERACPLIPMWPQLPSLPSLETPHQETALGLFREAMASESVLYRYLCFWNIINIPPRSPDQVKTWIDLTLTSQPHRFTMLKKAEVKRQQYGSLGHYLDEECRDAVTHILRNDPGRTSLDPNNWADIHRIDEAAGILYNFVEVYVEQELGLKAKVHPFQIQSTET